MRPPAAVPLLAVLLALPAGAAPPNGPELTRLLAEIKPQSAESPWREIAWLTDVTEADNANYISLAEHAHGSAEKVTITGSDLLAVEQQVAVGVGVERIGAAECFLGVGDPIAVRVGARVCAGRRAGRGGHARGCGPGGRAAGDAGRGVRRRATSLRHRRKVGVNQFWDAG